MARKTVCILGLGEFGLELAKSLNSNLDVIAIDKEMKNVEAIADYVSKAICLDFTDQDKLRAAGVEDADVGVVTCSTMLEEEIKGVCNLKELGIPYVIAKAKNKLNGEVLMKVGADDTISPEKEVARTLAKKLISNNILELFDVDKNYTIFDIKLPFEWINKTLIDLNLRSKYNINVIGVRRNGNLIVNFNPKEPLNKDDGVLIIGPNDLFERYAVFNNR